MNTNYTNRFCDQLAIHGTDASGFLVAGLRTPPFQIVNLTQQTREAEQFATYEAAEAFLIASNCHPLSVPDDGTFGYNERFEALCIDGTNDEDQMEGGALDAPFYVFNITRQCNESGPFQLHKEAVFFLAGLSGAGGQS